MTFTAEDIAREHEAAMASLTPEQIKALARLRTARQRAAFAGRSPNEILHGLFETEAQVRSALAVVVRAA
jgi:hypothetical protein